MFRGLVSTRRWLAVGLLLAGAALIVAAASAEKGASQLPVAQVMHVNYAVPFLCIPDVGPGGLAFFSPVQYRTTITIFNATDYARRFYARGAGPDGFTQAGAVAGEVPALSALTVTCRDIADQIAPQRIGQGHFFLHAPDGPFLVSAVYTAFAPGAAGAGLSLELREQIEPFGSGLTGW